MKSPTEADYYYRQVLVIWDSDWKEWPWISLNYDDSYGDIAGVDAEDVEQGGGFGSEDRRKSRLGLSLTKSLETLQFIGITDRWVLLEVVTTGHG